MRMFVLLVQETIIDMWPFGSILTIIFIAVFNAFYFLNSMRDPVSEVEFNTVLTLILDLYTQFFYGDFQDVVSKFQVKFLEAERDAIAQTGKVLPGFAEHVEIAGTHS